jgi:acyl-ACP thioesterase
MSELAPYSQIYTQKFSVRETDVDFAGNIRPSALLRCAEEIATAHVAYLGMDDAFFRRNHAAWLVGKQSLEFYRVPRKGEEITLITIPEQSRGGATKRVTVVQDAAAQTIAMVDSRWIFIDTDKKQIIRHPTEEMNAQWNEQVEEALPQTMPKTTELLDGGTRRAVYSICDINGHINNACYLDLACDVLPLEELRAHPMKRASLRYHREVPMGAEMQMLYGRVEDGWYVRGVREGHACFEAYCGF